MKCRIVYFDITEFPGNSRSVEAYVENIEDREELKRVISRENGVPVSKIKIDDVEPLE